MPLIDCEMNLIPTWLENFAIYERHRQTTFATTVTKLYISTVTLSTQDNPKLLQQLKSGFKRTINCNKYQSKVSMERGNQYLDYLIDPNFHGVNRLHVLSFEDNGHRTRHTRYFLPEVEIKTLIFWFINKPSLINQ